MSYILKRLLVCICLYGTIPLKMTNGLLKTCALIKSAEKFEGVFPSLNFWVVGWLVAGHTKRRGGGTCVHFYGSSVVSRAHSLRCIQNNYRRERRELCKRGHPSGDEPAAARNLSDGNTTLSSVYTKLTHYSSTYSQGQKFLRLTILSFKCLFDWYQLLLGRFTK